MAGKEEAKMMMNEEEVSELLSLLEKRKKKGKNIEDEFQSATIDESYNDKFKMKQKTVNISISRKSSVNFIAFIQSLRIVFTYLLNLAKASTKSEDDYVRFIFSHAPKSYFSTAVLPLSQFNVNYMLNIFERMMQSNRSLVANGWETNVVIQTFASGVSKNKKKNKNLRKKHIYRHLGNVNDDEGGVNKYVEKYGRKFRTGVFYIICDVLNRLVKNCCFVVSLLVSLSFLKKDSKYVVMERTPHKPVDKLYDIDEIRDVYRQSGIPEGSVKTKNFRDIYENFLKVQGVELVVYSDQYDDCIIYDSRTDEEGNLIKLTDKVVCLWLNNNHYDVVLNMCKFAKLNPYSFCVKCMSHFRYFERKNTHICNNNLTCQRCFRQSECLKNIKVECDKCNILFFNETCFRNHLLNRVFKPMQSNHGKLTPCQYYFFCNTCAKIVPRFFFFNKSTVKKHDCNKKYCFHCLDYKKKSHYCYMTPLTIPKKETGYENNIFFFDFETRIGENNEMIPFYCVVQKVCKKCEKTDFKKNKNYLFENQEVFECCGVRELVFKGDNVISELCEFILTNENSVWIAHNGGRFDTIFIFKHLLEKKIYPETIMHGSKVMMMKLTNENIVFFDSFSFLHMSLAKIPETMGLKNLCKGFHPYFFYDLNYSGEIVDRKYFDVENMDKKKKKEFEKWYLVKKGKPYIFEEEMYYYCSSDVDILRRGCIKFSSLIKETGNVAPFYDTSCITIASLAMKIFRLNFLRKSCIGIIPAGGYRGKVNQSVVALIWLEQINEEVGGNLEYKCSQNGEKMVLNRFVDGFYNDTIYQFHGCFFHGCPSCFHPYEVNKINNEKFCNLYSSTKKFTYQLREAGYTVIEKWECDFLKENNITKSFLDAKKKYFYPYTPLEVRDALYGGRTSPVCLFKNVEEDEKIFYVDFTSLYPYVQKKEKFPVGHPTIYIKDECDSIELSNVFGLVKCCILPPRDLYFPVLPVRMEGKLLFPLCYTCAATVQLTHCNHNESERSLLGTWTSVEINKAIEKGYRVLKIYEIYHFSRQERIFQDYVNCFLKIKQEASGFPAECYDENKNLIDSEVDKYIKNYYHNEGIMLSKEKIEYNPGLRAMAKYILNSLWGKFAQNENNTKVDFLSEYDELLNIANDPNLKLTSTDFVNSELLRVTYVKKDEINTSLKTGNVTIACFVTAFARLKLYNLIDSLGDRALYYDTDSVIYLKKNNDIEIETGNYLGELTNELKEGEWITQFCSTGPKSYSYCTNLKQEVEEGEEEGEEEKFKEVVHIKGFTLENEKVKEKLNFKSLVTCVEKKEQKIEIVYEKKITRDKLNHIFIENETKTFNFTFNKRIVKNNFYTIPYGFLDGE